MNNQVQPIFILPENTQRNTGKNAQRVNISAAKVIAETVRTTLGPKGMDKMLVDNVGDVIVTNDGVTILNEMTIEHPTAKMIVEVAKTLEDEVGDGTTTAVVIAGEILKMAEELLDQNIHPTVIAKGYAMACEKSVEILNRISEPVTERDRETLKKIAMTAMTGKGAESAKERLSGLAVEAVMSILEVKNGVKNLDREDIKIEKRIGGSYDDSELINGIVIDKERVHSGMPTFVKDAKIALIDSALEIKNTEIEAKIQISDPNQLQAFLAQEESMLKEKVDTLKKAGANVVFCQKGIDDLVQHFLAKEGIVAVRRVKRSDMDKLSKATGAKVVTKLSDISKEDLGYAGTFEEMQVGDEQMSYVQGCKNPKAVTILIRGGTEHVIDEIKRACDDAIGDIISVIKTGKVVAGAGSTEIELSRELRKYADSLSGREQLAVKAFAESLEIIPKTLSENAGLDPIDILAELSAAHDKGRKWAGINVFTGKIIDSWKDGIVEPLKIKTQAVTSATEVANMILRIDDVISSAESKGQEMQGGMPPGMPPGGMPPGY